jgi:hypothetical protein
MDNPPIDAEIAEFVDQKRQPPAAAMFQKVTDQAGLAGAKKARNYGSWDLHGHGGLLVRLQLGTMRGRIGPAEQRDTRRAATNNISV